MALNDLNQMFSIVDPATGKPTDYLMRLLRDRGITADNLEETVTILQGNVTTLTTRVNAIDGTVFTAGTGLTGGGTLGTDDPITFSLNASIDDLTDVDTSTTPPTDGQALVWNAAGSTWLPGTISGGGGSSWTALSDTTISSPVGSVDVDVTGYTDIYITGLNLTTSTTTRRRLQVSVDGGSTYYSTSGDYVFLSSGGATTNAPDLISSDSTSGARTFSGLISSNIDGVLKSFNRVAPNEGRIFVASTDAITHIRVTSDSGNLTGGRVIVSGR